MKGILIVLDGAADEACQALGQSTPLQAAKTPHLDSLARKSRIDYFFPIKEGITPDSANATLALLGYDPQSTSLGALEATGAGVSLTRGDLAIRTNFATIDELKNGTVLDRRAGRTLTTRDVQKLSQEINTKLHLPFAFEFHPTWHHRGVLVFRGGFSDNISSADPSHGTTKRIVRPTSLPITFSEPMDDEDDSKLASDLVNTFMRKSHEVLDSNPLNVDRAKKGLFSANFLLCRDAGNERPRFKKLKGKWMALGYTPLERGIATAAKMNLYNVRYPKMKSIDVYANLYDGLNKSIKNAIRMIKKYKKQYDYFYIHFRETDIPGRDNKPLEKVKMIELLDKKFFSALISMTSSQNAKIVVTSTQTTSCRQKTTTTGSVPVLYYDPNGERDQEQRFTEEQGLKGKKMTSKTLLEKTLLAK